MVGNVHKVALISARREVYSYSASEIIINRVSPVYLMDV